MQIQQIASYNQYSRYTKQNKINKANTFRMKKYIGDMILSAEGKTLKRMVKIFKDAPDDVIKEYATVKNDEHASELAYKKLKDAIDGIPHFNVPYTFKNYDPCATDYEKDVQYTYIFGLME